MCLAKPLIGSLILELVKELATLRVAVGPLNLCSGVVVDSAALAVFFDFLALGQHHVSTMVATNRQELLEVDLPIELAQDLEPLFVGQMQEELGLQVGRKTREDPHGGLVVVLFGGHCTLLGRHDGVLVLCMILVMMMM